jgi:hypothetical protein
MTGNLLGIDIPRRLIVLLGRCRIEKVAAGIPVCDRKPAPFHSIIGAPMVQG